MCKWIGFFTWQTFLFAFCLAAALTSFVRQTITNHVGKQESLLNINKHCKLAWYTHVIHHNAVAKTILQGTVEGKHCRGCQHKSWQNNTKEWTGQSSTALLPAAKDRQQCRVLIDTSILTPPQQRSIDWRWWWWWLHDILFYYSILCIFLLHLALIFVFLCLCAPWYALIYLDFTNFFIIHFN